MKVRSIPKVYKNLLFGALVFCIGVFLLAILIDALPALVVACAMLLLAGCVTAIAYFAANRRDG